MILLYLLPQALKFFLKSIRFLLLILKKIEQVLPFEIKGALAFPLEATSLDFIQTKKEKSESTILAAAIAHERVSFIKEIAEKNRFKNYSVTTEIISLYSLYKRLVDKKITSVFMFYSQKSLNMGYVEKGCLKKARTLSLQEFSDETWKTIEFTLQSFALAEQIETVTLFPSDQGFKEFMQSHYTGEIVNFALQDIENKLNLKQGILKQNTLLSFVCSLPYYNEDTLPQTEFNLKPQKQEALSLRALVALGLPLALLVSTLTYSIITTQTLSAYITKKQHETIKSLKKQFPSIRATSLKTAYDSAQRSFKKESVMWESLASQNKQSFLSYLYHLTEKIDKEALGLNLKKVTINNSTITLSGSVRSFEAVEQFEEQLKATNLFTSVPDMQKVEFDVQLPLQAKGGA